MNSRHRTLLLSEIFPPQTGGSGRWYWEIYKRLSADDYVLAVNEYAGATAFDATHQLDLHRMPLHFAQWGLRTRRGLADYYRLWRSVGQLAKRRQVNRIHAARCLPVGWLAWMLKHTAGIPYVVYVHGEEVEYAQSSRELTWMVHRVMCGADFMICNSQNTKNILNKWHVDPAKIRVMHPGVDTRVFVPAERDVDERDALGWGDRPVVMTAGRLQRRKGHDMLLTAIDIVRQQVPDVLLAVCGDGEERGRLDQLVDDARLHDHVQFLGPVDDTTLRRCYQQCDLFVLANRRVGEDIEGFGIVLVEAQACGKPVIAGASGGTVETMDIPHTGLVVDCREPGRLADEISNLLLDDERRRKMGEAARAWAEQNFDWTMLANDAKTLFTTGQLPQRQGKAEEALVN